MRNDATVLVIDDEEASRDVLVQFFTRIGWRTITAQDGQEGIDRMREGPFKLIFLDLHMPNMSGLEALPRIHDLDMNARIIIMTAYASYESKVEAREQGAYDYLVKPVTLTKIKEIAEKAIPEDSQPEDIISDDGLARVELDITKLNRNVARLIPERIARAFFLVAVAKYENNLTVAMVDPSDKVALDTLNAETGCRILTLQTEQQDVMAAIQIAYGESSGTTDAMPTQPAQQPGQSMRPDTEILVDIDVDTTSVTDVFDQILSDAIQRQASAIHFEPRADTVIVRMRIEDRLRPFARMPARVAPPLITQIRKLAHREEMGTHPIPYGCGQVRKNNEVCDLSFHIIPTIHGESAVIHLHAPHARAAGLDDLELDALSRRFFLDAIQQPYGMIYVTGPPDNGQRTTLYATLHHLNHENRKILTLEDPVVYDIDGVNQVSIRFDLGQTYATTLRGMLHHDPDVILIEETPDSETATLAVRTAATGHLILSTVYATDTISCITYLRSLGIPPFLLSRALNLIVAQYRIRQICQHCKTDTTPSQKILDSMTALGHPRMPTMFFAGVGCGHCAQTGYHGSISVYEFLPITDRIKQAISTEADTEQLRREAVATGCPTLLDAGLTRVADGLVTLDDFAHAVLHL